ncbi:hypothetical protein ACFP1Z_29705 [Streptomyces gamaensis]|uniref:DUF5134 domain-containing protein n=1 Tax=Streptomyces gamaensis TaxID=1763542 RepID=A0ABW0Z896_9ACTN
MHPPVISTDTWWILAAVSTALYLAVCIPVMPTQKYRIRAACLPLIGLLYLSVAAALRGHDLDKTLSLHATVMLAFVFGLLGRAKEVKEAAEAQEKAIGGQTAPAPRRLTVQLSASALAGLLLWLWLRWG